MAKYTTLMMTASYIFRIWSIKGEMEWQEDEEEDARSCWMTLRTGEDTLIGRRKL